MQSPADNATLPAPSDADFSAWASVPWSPVTDPDTIPGSNPDATGSGDRDSFLEPA